MKSVKFSDVHEPTVPIFLPRWINPSRDDAADSLAFASGAALATLDLALRDVLGNLQGPLLCDRLALDASAACLRFEGRRDTTFDIRDAVCLTRAGDAMGPAGDMFVQWRKLARINLKTASWQNQMRAILPDQVAEILPKPEKGSPVTQATRPLIKILHAFPHHETAALMAADVMLSKEIGWDRPLPLLATSLTGKALRDLTDGDGDPLSHIHRAIIVGCDKATRTIADLNRRVVKLRQVAPKLRSKGAADAVTLFLSHDAVSPSGMLSPMIKGTSIQMTDRSARRLCDRLVDLGAVRELTGRSTFRLYGV